MDMLEIIATLLLIATFLYVVGILTMSQSPLTAGLFIVLITAGYVIYDYDTFKAGYAIDRFKNSEILSGELPEIKSEFWNSYNSSDSIEVVMQHIEMLCLKTKNLDQSFCENELRNEYFKIQPGERT